MTRHEFLNRIRSLHCIDASDLPLSPEQGRAFIADPVRFIIRTDDDVADAIFAAVEARQARDAERDRLREVNAELVEATKILRRHLALFCSQTDEVANAIFDFSDAAIAKATGAQS